MNSQDFRDFTSWDEIQPGDILTWWAYGEYKGYEVEYIQRVDASSISAKTLKTPYSSGITVENFSSARYPTEVFSVVQGWKVKITEQPYDPTQAGDTEDDI